ncbi:MAG: transglycosylase domain-containing protein [Firmicutes bacterium]|nr:transglycosylase domain-containing protein [Bacillota bacterium]
MSTQVLHERTDPIHRKQRQKTGRAGHLLTLFTIGALTATAIGFVTWQKVSEELATPRVNLAALAVTSEPSDVFDRYGHLLFVIPPKGPIDVPLSATPRLLQRALIATEDAGFYHQDGFSLESYVRAAWHDVVHHDEGQGGSTLTQQLAKIVYLSDNKTLNRKWQQLILGIQIAKRYNHNQILDFYLNRVYFGGGATGIVQAAYTYFGLRPNQLHRLTLVQSALLAGMPQAPSLYDPLVHPGLARKRRNEVLQRMEMAGYLTPQAMRRAQAAPLELHPGRGTGFSVPTVDESYRDYLLTELASLHLSGLLVHGGIRIDTDLDPRLQQATYDAVNNTHLYPTPLSTAHEELQGAAVMIDPHTGGIMALVGGKANTYTVGGFDYATQTERSPGSAMKPLVVYGPAIQTGRWNASSAVEDGLHNQLTFSGYTVSDWEPHWTDNGMVSIRWALAESWNAPAVWLLHEIGVNRGIAFADRAGLSLNHPADRNLTIALGNVIPGISPLTLADAYASFDNNGVRMPAHAVMRIVSDRGKVMYQARQHPVTVMSKSTAHQMVALLENNVTNGIVAGASAPGHEVAGKTGSVAYNNWSRTDSDLWVAAFTPNVVGAIWEGYPHTTLADSLPQWSSKYPPMMFSAIIRQGWPSHGGRFPVRPAVGPDYPTNFPAQHTKPARIRTRSHAVTIHISVPHHPSQQPQPPKAQPPHPPGPSHPPGRAKGPGGPPPGPGRGHH